jgi:RNA polymerase sigma factor for flagellar operon FliA
MSRSACVETGLAVAKTQGRTKQRQLWQRYQRTRNGSAVEGELIQQYLPLVRAVTGRLAMTLPSHVDVDDLYSAGLVGLVNALRHFDPGNGARFETYARFRIRGAMMDELRRMDWVPRSVRDKARKVRAVMHAVEQEKGALPTEQEMARAMKISVTEYYQLLDEIRPTTFISLDAADDANGEEGATEYEAIADPSAQTPGEQAVREDLAQIVAERIQQLPEMQRKVLALYYDKGLRLREIAEAFGLTESRICQIHAQAILAIKAFVGQLEASPKKPQTA